MRALGADQHLQRAAVYWQQIDVVHLQAELVEECPDRRDGPVGQMLMIYVVELGIAQNLAEIDSLDTERAGIADQQSDALGRAMQFLKMKKYAGRGHQLRPAARLQNFVRGVGIEKAIERIDTLCIGLRGKIARRLDPDSA